MKKTHIYITLLIAFVLAAASALAQVASVANYPWQVGADPAGTTFVFGYLGDVALPAAPNMPNILVLQNDGKVGIGTASPQILLDVRGSTPRMGVRHSTINLGSGVVAGELLFGTAANTFSGTHSADAVIKAVSEATQSGTSHATGLAFFTKPSSLGPGSAALERVRIDKDGAVGIGTTRPRSNLHIASLGFVSIALDNRERPPDNRQWVIRTEGAGNNFGIGPVNDLFTAGTYGIRIIREPPFGVKSVLFENGNVGIGTRNPTKRLEVEGNATVTGDVRAKSVFANTRIYEPMLVYDNIYDALTAGDIQKSGSPSWDETTYKTTQWWGKNILKIGAGAQADGDGLTVNVPPGTEVLWVRILLDRWTQLHVRYDDGSSGGEWTGGYTRLNQLTPDGGKPTHQIWYHAWMAIPLAKPGPVILSSRSRTSSGAWISGIAFGKNPYNHAYQSAINIHWGLNGGTGTDWGGHDWNRDHLGWFKQNRKYQIKVPVTGDSGDRVLYFIEHNNNWEGSSVNITIGNWQAPNLATTFMNPFAMHYNSKLYQRYYAVVVPENVWKNNRAPLGFLDVTVTTEPQMQWGFHFREVGTHIA